RSIPARTPPRRAQEHRIFTLFKSVLPAGIEPTSSPPQGDVLSIERRERANGMTLLQLEHFYQPVDDRCFVIPLGEMERKIFVHFVRIHVDDRNEKMRRE